MSDTTLLLLVWAVGFAALGASVAVPLTSAFERRRRPAPPAHPALDPRVQARERQLAGFIEEDAREHARVERELLKRVERERARAEQLLLRARRAERRARAMRDTLGFIFGVDAATLRSYARQAGELRRAGWTLAAVC